MVDKIVTQIYDRGFTLSSAQPLVPEDLNSEFFDADKVKIEDGKIIPLSEWNNRVDYANGIPSFSGTNTPIIVDEGTQYVLSTIIHGKAAPTVAWQSSVDGTTWIAAVGLTTAFTTNGDYRTYTATKPVATLSDPKYFRVMATGTGGAKASPVISLTVRDIPAPVFTQQPANDIRIVGAQSVFNAAAKGASSITWQFFDATLSTPTWVAATRITATPVVSDDLLTSTASIPAVVLADDGSYRAMAVGNGGTTYSNTVTLTVNAS